MKGDDAHSASVAVEHGTPVATSQIIKPQDRYPDLIQAKGLGRWVHTAKVVHTPFYHFWNPLSGFWGGMTLMLIVYTLIWLAVYIRG